MSFILDALKKSEAERQRRAGPALLEMRVTRPQRRVPGWVLIGIGTLVVANLLAVLWWLLKPTAETPVVASVPAGVAATAILSTSGTTAPVVESPETPVASLGGAVQSAQIPDPGFVVAGDSLAAGPLPRYENMPAEMPKLRLDMHVYSPAAKERYAYINMRKVREGDTTAEGMRVLSITSEGVELRYRNSDFFLGRE